MNVDKHGEVVQHRSSTANIDKVPRHASTVTGIPQQHSRLCDAKSAYNPLALPHLSREGRG